MTLETFIKAEVAAFAYQQAHHLGGMAPMTAIACVLRNRVKAGWFGGDWQQNLNHAGESAAHSYRPSVPVDITNPALRRLLNDVEDLFAGQFRDEMTEGGLYWLDPSRDEPICSFFRTNILQRPEYHRRVAQVGTLWIFS